MPSLDSKIDDVVLRALELASEERAAFVARECGDDATLRNEVEDLLTVRDSALQRADGSVFELIATESDSTLETLGPYGLEAKIGEGGTSEVYRGRRLDGSDSRPVAIKLLKRGMDTEEILRRFEREGSILSALRHPNIARVFGGGVSSDHRPYLVMELIEGASIRRYCERQQLPIEQRIQLLITACEAIAYAHRNLIVHRDLKPDNMLVTDDGTLKILDFGISKLLDPSSGPLTLTDPGHRMLTPEYAAPEQLAMARISTAADVYSLGVMLYELAVGRLPFERSEASLSFLRQVLEEEPESPRTHNPRIAADLDAIICKALAKRPADRYDSVESFARDLRDFLAHRPILAARGGWRYRLAKLARRRGRELTFAFLAALVAGGVTFDRLDAQRRIVDEKNRAVAAQEFVLDLFQKVDPYLGGNRELDTLEGFLAGWQGEIDQLQDLPEFKARMQLGLARLLGNFDYRERSLRAAESALRGLRSLAEPDLLEVAKAEILVSDLLVFQSRFDDAEPHLRRAISDLEAIERLEARHLAEAKTSLVRLVGIQGRLSEAVELQREVLTLTRGNEDPLVQALQVEVKLHVGTAYLQQGDAVRALPFLDATWRGAVNTFGENESRTLYAQRVFARALALAGQEREAVRKLESVVEVTRAAPQMRTILADALLDLGRVIRLEDQERARRALLEARELYASHPEPNSEALRRCDELLQTLKAPVAN